MKMLFFLSLMAISLNSHAASYAGPLLDFNVHIQANDNVRSPVVVQICSKEAVKTLAYARTGTDIAEQNFNVQTLDGSGSLDTTSKQVPVLKGCTTIDGMDNFKLNNLNLSLIGIFKAGIQNKIAPNDLMILVSTVEVNAFHDNRYFGNTYLDPMQLPVASMSSNQNLIVKVPALDPSAEMTVTTTVQDPINPAYAKLNTPAALHRSPVMQKVMSIANGRPLLISDFLKYELLYFATEKSNAQDWKKLMDTTEAEIIYQGGAQDAISSLQNTPAFQKVEGMNLDQMIDLYVSVYKCNLADVVEINDVNPKAALSSMPGTSDLSPTEQLAQYNLQREKAIDFISAINGSMEIGSLATQAAKGWLDQVLH